MKFPNLSALNQGSKRSEIATKSDAESSGNKGDEQTAQIDGDPVMIRGLDKFKKDARRIQEMYAHERDPNLSFEEQRFMQNYLNSLLTE